ncbi:aldehyde dehydrogenase [Devosia sp.]|uniref:aldehyde dehydrogenase n=1 Tax=Devosia sp. TaxID=1871048 RepID=UPI0025DDE755|nr:aldehyde dehydrogenase [Devosia sp.]MCR6633732.1 aldehyde dehydrogenase [Devosia sp.]
MLDQAGIDRLASVPIAPQQHLINGVRVSAEQRLDVVSPINGKVITSIADASAGDVDRAVAAARAAYDKGTWSRSAPAFRKKVLHRLADLIEEHALELAVLGVRDNGTEISMAYKAEPLSAAGSFRYYAEAIDKIYDQIAPTAPDVLALIHREPLGVVGAIVPWNFPLMIGAWKIAPALASGNCVVLKPAEIASLSLLRLGELALEAGVPPGVFNVVTGRGASAGKALGLHMDVDALAFTGSGPVGRKLLEYSAQSNIKRVFLELGGKSPNVVFDDVADIDEAVKVSAAGIFRNSGQVCVAGSRLIVQEGIYDAFMERLVAATGKMKVGNPLDLASDIGAVASAEQLQKDLGFVETARAEGGTVLTGGARVNVESGGFYMAPTIVADVTPEMALSREEVFGPVLAVTRFKTAEEAVRIANSTVYGLASAVWTSSLTTAHTMVRAINAGIVHVNTYGGSDMTVPLGGFKQSGFGRDKSLHALDKYTDLKTAWIDLK